MYPSPQKSTSRTPARTRKSRSALSSHADSGHQIARLPSPAATLSSASDLKNPAWKTFDWSLLSTPQSKLRTLKIKTIDALRRDCVKKLNDLDTSPFKNQSLKLLISGIRSIIDQKWKFLLVYFDEDCEFPHLERPWSHKEWRRWDVVHFFVKMAVSYNRACEAAAKAGEGLCGDQADQELLGFLSHVFDLGAAAAMQGEETIVIKEWERTGTLLTLRCEGVCVSDVSVGDENKARISEGDASADVVRMEIVPKP